MVFSIGTGRLSANEGAEKSEGKGVVIIIAIFTTRNLKRNNTE